MNTSFERLWKQLGNALCVGLVTMTALLSEARLSLAQAAVHYRLDPAFQRPSLALSAYPIRVIADGRAGLLWTFFAGGALDGVNGQRSGALLRTTLEGVPDASFAIGPLLVEAWATAVQADGNILVGGAMAGDLHAPGIPNYHVFRFDTNGVFDFSYHSPVFDGLPRFMTLQPDGRLLVDNSVNAAVGNGGIRGLARLHPNGSLDRGFQMPATDNYFFAPPVVDPAGNILVGGRFHVLNGASRPSVARLFSDGTLDPTFDPVDLSVLRSSTVRGMVLQADGKLVLAGRIYLGTNTTRYALARLNPDGTLDTSFNLLSLAAAGFPTVYPRLLKALPSGKLLAVGDTVARFNADGTLDASYSAPTLTFAPDTLLTGCYWMETLPDGKVVVPSYSALSVNGTPVGGSFRLATNGTLDTAYAAPAFQGETYAVAGALQPDGRPVVWGWFDRAGAWPARGVVRLSTDGAADPAYGAGLPPDARVVHAAAMAPDGSLYATILRGSADLLNGPASNCLIRLTPQGQVDAAFQADGAVPPYSRMETGPYSLLVQSNRPVVWRNSAQAVVNGRPFFVRLNLDGSRDTSFASPSTPFGRTNWLFDYLESVVVGDGHIYRAASNGTMIAAGTIGDYSDPTASYVYEVIKLDPDGRRAGGFAGPTAVGSPPRSSSTSKSLIPSQGPFSTRYRMSPSRGATRSTTPRYWRTVQCWSLALSPDSGQRKLVVWRNCTRMVRSTRRSAP